jgi:hypothetical protein
MLEASWMAALYFGRGVFESSLELIQLHKKHRRTFVIQSARPLVVLYNQFEQWKVKDKSKWVS